MTGIARCFLIIVSAATSATAMPQAGRAAGLPAWLTISDTANPPVAQIPPIDPRRLAALAKDKHGFVERLIRHQIDRRADGMIEERPVIARQFLSEDGARSGGTVSMFVRTATDRLVIEEAYLLSPTGEWRPFDRTLVQVRTGSGRDLFSDVNEVVLPFSRVEVGATVVVAARRIRDLRRWPLPWSEVVHTQFSVPIETFELTVRWPVTMSAPIYKSDDTALKCVGEATALRCRRSSIPPVAEDPEIRSWPDLLPHIAIADGDQWDELVARERSILDRSAPPSPAVVGLASRLVKGAKTFEDRVERLFRFVADDIRYVGFEHGRGAVEPRPPEVTLERRFGDCKDKVALLLALARAIGLSGHAVLVASDRHDPSKLLMPSWKYFDHVIACLNQPSSDSLLCMDPTDPDLPAGVLSQGVRSAVVLAVLQGAKPGHLPRGNGVSTPGWAIGMDSTNKIACDGSVAETLTRSYGSAGAGLFRGRLRAQNATERRRWMEDSYARVMGDAAKPTTDVSGLDDTRERLRLKTTTTYPGRSPVKGWTEWAEKDNFLVSIGSDFLTGNQHHPYVTNGLAIESHSTFELCNDVVPRFVGPSLDLVSSFGRLTRTYTHDRNIVKVRTTFVIKPQLVPRDRLAPYNKFVKTALAQSRIWFSLVPKMEAAP